ncbi:MAG: Arm DNA-binding domain-containing protein [Proteobacteria bacterium]|nr:Arm DNA-binding domain-containing protein [Pseudomonadota bacterium]
MPKRISPLNEKKINAAQPKDRVYRLFDGNGLFLFITPQGGKWWRFKYRFEGKAKMLSFGVYPEVSLNEARSRKDVARELLSQGIDPSELRKEEKERNKTERLEAERIPSVRITIEGKIEIWKGSNIMRFSKDEARFVANILNNLVG